MKFDIITIGVLSILITGVASAQAPCVPPSGGKCLTASQYTAVQDALKELDTIHKAPAVVTTKDKITIITDWQGRVYTSGGQTDIKTPGPNQLHMNVTLGPTVNRDLVMTLPTSVYYRDKPPDPMFRLRIRAQVNLLLPELFNTATGDTRRFYDAGVSWDFFHLGVFNAAAYTGVFSSGGGLGMDLTRNWGVYAGYALVYDGWRSSVALGSYISFN